MNKKFAFLSFVSLILCVVGIVMLSLSKKNSEVFIYEEEMRIANIIDAGGSGTRLLVFKFSKDFKKLQQHKIKCEKKGLQNYLPSEYETLKLSLKECYKKGSVFLPKGSVTPVWFAATAGMRLLKLRNKKRNNEIWRLVGETLKASSYDVRMNKTIPGEDEAKFSWISANLLKKTLSLQEKVGLLEEGSSSFQFAFQNNGTAGSSENIDQVEVDGRNISLYRYSYLCYGEAEMFRKHHAQVVTDSNYSDISNDPCTNKGYNWSHTSEYLWNVPCVKGKYAKEHFGYQLDGPVSPNTSVLYNISGTGNADECMNIVKRMIRYNCSNGQNTCGMEGISQPALHGMFIAIGNIYYLTNFMRLPFNGNRSEFWRRTKKLCRTSYSEVLIKYPHDPLYGKKRCFQAVLTYFYLNNGFKFNEDTWDIQYTSKINGASVGWPLGLAYSIRQQAYVQTSAKIEKRNDGQSLKLILGVVFIIASLILSIILIWITCFKKNKYRT